MVNSPARAVVDVGSVIADTYTIEALLGRGGMGAVFLASHKRLAGKRVAIKILHTEIEDTEIVARFKREAEIAAKLNHPNIVGVIDYNVAADGMPYLVLDYLEGETLAQRIARGPMAIDQVMSIVRQVGSALAAAHRAGIVHRDLKPQNIFLVPTEIDGRLVEIAKVLDFGISKIRGSQTVKTQDSVLLGTPQYMAPEQAIGQHASIDERTDVFALGAIVYEMLCGQAAFAGESLPVVVFKVVYEQPPPLAEQAPSVPPAMVAAVNRAMAKPSDERFATVGGFVEALTGRPLAATREPAAAAPTASDVPSGSRGVATGEAFAHTMGSGDHGGPPINPLLATAAPSASRTTTPNRPIPSAPANRSSFPGGAPSAAALSSTAAVASITALPSAPGAVGAVPALATSLPDRASGSTSLAPVPVQPVEGHRISAEPLTPRRSTGLVAAILVAVAAAAAGAVYLARRPGPVDPEQHAARATRPGDVNASTGAPRAADTAPAEIQAVGTHATEARPTAPAPGVQDPTGVKPATPGPTDATRADPAPIKTAGTKPAAPKTNGKPRPRPSVAPDTAGSSEPDEAPAGDGDDSSRQDLKQAALALAQRNYDLAERVANAVINSSAAPKLRAQAKLVHGTVQCLARNDHEAAQIDLRSLQRFPVLSARLIKVCREHGITIAP